MHPRCDHEINEHLELDLIHKKFEFFELFLRKRRSPEPHGVVGLRTSIMKRDYAVSIFVDAFIQMIEVRGAVYN